MDVLVDCAGAVMGGARRFLDELMAWLARNPALPVRLTGLGRRVGASYLAGREIRAMHGRHQRVIALNNVGFVGCTAERWVLLRNPLHFLTPREKAEISHVLGARMRAQTHVVRLAARRADVIVVPTGEMGGRVLAYLPGLADRLMVAPHPISPRPPAPRIPGLVVCPVLLAPWKGMRRHLDVLEKAVRELRTTCPIPVDVRVTATRAELESLGHGSDCMLQPVGRLSISDLDALVCQSHATYYPTTIESFGYPLAEARANGQAVVGQDTPRTREVAGPALVPFAEETPQEVAAALRKAVEAPPPPPDPASFCPDTYFGRWLA